MLAPLLVLIATPQLTLAAFTQTTVFVRTKVFKLSASETIVLADEPFAFCLAMAEAVLFLSWAAWICGKAR